MEQTPPNTGPGYVFEVREDKSVSFRRADMQTPSAREALLIFLGTFFDVDIADHDIDYILDRAPAEWRYIAVMLHPGHAARRIATLQVAQAEREPGKNSGENAVIPVSKPFGCINARARARTGMHSPANSRVRQTFR